MLKSTLAAAFLLAPISMLHGQAGGERPSFETLLRLNAERIFGGKVEEINASHVRVVFLNTEDFQRGFNPENLISPKDLHGNQKMLTDNVDNLIGASDKNGNWTSRFEIGDEFKINFTMKAPILVRGSQLNIQVADKKDFLISQTFQKAILIKNGKPVKQELTPLKEFSGPPEKWFDRKADKLQVEVAYAANKFNVKLKDKDMVALEDKQGIAGGRIEIQFRNLTFAFGNLRISAKLNKPWCEAQLKALEEKGKLKLKEDPPPAAAAAAEAAKVDPAKEKEDLRQKEADEDL